MGKATTTECCVRARIVERVPTAQWGIQRRAARFVPTSLSLSVCHGMVAAGSLEDDGGGGSSEEDDDDVAGREIRGSTQARARGR